MIKLVVAGLGLLILTLVLQLTVIPILGFEQYVNILLVLTIMAVLTLGIAETIWWIVAAAAIVDSYSLLPFGIILTSTILTVLLIDGIARRWVTNRATITIGLLIVGATVLQTMLILLGTHVLYWLNLNDLTIAFNGRTLGIMGMQVLGNSALAMMLGSAIKTSRLSTTGLPQNHW